MFYGFKISCVGSANWGVQIFPKLFVFFLYPIILPIFNIDRRRSSEMEIFLGCCILLEKNYKELSKLNYFQKQYFFDKIESTGRVTEIQILTIKYLTYVPPFWLFTISNMGILSGQVNLKIDPVFAYFPPLCNAL